MKPIELTIDGINSFSDRQVIDLCFDGLFCISGDTGSGKTTILDCIIIALYGSTKRTSTISDYINLRRDKAEVRLVFETETDGERHRYEVTRYLSRTINKARLVDLTTGVTIAEQTEKVNAAIMDMIQLSRDDFTQVVILEQGKFAKFLTAGKKERNNTVGNLFKLHKYKELGSRVNGKMTAVKGKLELVDKQLSQLENVTSSLIKDKEKCIQGMKKRITELDSLEEKLAKEVALGEKTMELAAECEKAELQLQVESERAARLKAELDSVTEQAKECTRRYKEVCEQKSALELTLAKASELKRLLEERDRRLESLERLREEWRLAEKEKKFTEAELSQTVERRQNLSNDLLECKSTIFKIANLDENAEYYDISDIKAQCMQLVNDYKNAVSECKAAAQKEAECEESVRVDTSNHAAALARKAADLRTRDSLAAECEELHKRLEEERRLEAAQFIRSGLAEGDTCPVCGGKIGHVPCEELHSEVETLYKAKKEELARAESALAESEKSSSSFGARLEGSKKALSDAKTQHGIAEKKVDNLEAKVDPDKIDRIPQLLAAAVDLFGRLAKCESDVKLLEQKKEAATKRAAEIFARGDSERKEVDRLGDEISRSEIGEEQLKRLVERANELTELGNKLDAQSHELERQKEDVSAKYAASNATVKILTDKVSQKPVFDKQKFDSIVESQRACKSEREGLIASVAGTTAELNTLNSQFVVKTELDAQKKSLKAEIDIYSDLYKLVSGDKFIEYIAEEYILQFTDAASLVLSDITGGKYTLMYKGGEFYVADFLSGGKERKAGTLSGGETFLASLSLAIAISREIARFKTYEFFFLDEGFGTLDARSLDTVADALVALSGDTLVGVVTHRAELTDRIFDKITVLPPSGDRGSVIVRT